MRKISILTLFTLINFFIAYPLHVEGIWRETCNLFGKSNNQQQSSIIKPKVGIIEINDSLDLKKTCYNLINIAKNDAISGIILIVYNSGGSFSDYSTLHDLIKKITPTKPVVALVISALSGGYLIASATNYIIAHSASTVGSIGSAIEIRRDKKLKNKGNKNKGNIEAQTTIELFKTGKYKALYSPYANDLSDEERAFIQEDLEKHYQYLTNLVANNRNLSLKDSEKWADGKSFFGTEAIEMGLIDEIGTYFDAENKILELISQRNPDNSYGTEIKPIYF